MQTHDQRPGSDHVVCVGEGDEQYGGQVMDQHDHKILVLEKERRATAEKKGNVVKRIFWDGAQLASENQICSSLIAAIFGY